jgi:hypothetical protein
MSFPSSSRESVWPDWRDGRCGLVLAIYDARRWIQALRPVVGGSRRRFLGDEVEASWNGGQRRGRLGFDRDKLPVRCSLCGGEQQRRGGAGEEAPTADGAPRHVQIFGPERPPFLASPPLPLILTSQIFLILCFYFFQVW